ncbi:MAG: copper resistance protein CopC [Thermomicrobiales bacterium]
MKRPSIRLVFALVALFFVAPPAHLVSAHAEPARADPPINGTVAAAPQILEIWFAEEVESQGLSMAVFGTDCARVDLRDTAIDLNDPEHKHVTVTLRPNLPDGVYTVQWTTTSAEDGDEASGSYMFSVGAATPEATAMASPSASPAASPTPCPSATPAAVVGQVTQPSKFDSRALAISVGVGILAALFIYAFWVLVRPKKSPRLT